MDYVSLNELGLLQISGSESTDFLQGQLSCDVREVTPTQSRLTTHCNSKGRILATGRLLYVTPCYYLLVPTALVDTLLKDLCKYAAFYQVSLQDASQSLAKIGLVGLNLMSELWATLSLEALEENKVYTLQESNFLVMPGKLPRVIVLGKLPNSLDQAGQAIKPFSYWKIIDISSGIAQVTSETRGLYTPHQLNYHQQGGISFTKGCYTGQEVIARMHYLGKLKQSLYKLRFKSAVPPLSGASITDIASNGQGTLVMAALDSSSPEDCVYQALAVIQDAAIASPLYLSKNPIDELQKVSH